ncbi:MAG: hypothetical protein CK425_10125 [Parachlamydia sp.]|nr:MAG: hypothetical protein CK425_10125 [Parachlamydia sp.]
MSIGQVVQTAAAFVTGQNCFNWLLNNYPSIADWLSSSNRVAIGRKAFELRDVLSIENIAVQALPSSFSIQF